MKFSRVALPLIAAACILTTGCAPHPYYGPPPPPPPGYHVSPLIARADQIGFRMGSDDGARDAYGHHPNRDRKFRDTSGYDPALGPFGPYRDAFRSAYVRGYDRGFYRR